MTSMSHLSRNPTLNLVNSFRNKKAVFITTDIFFQFTMHAINIFFVYLYEPTE